MKNYLNPWYVTQLIVAVPVILCNAFLYCRLNRKMNSTTQVKKG